MDKNTYCISIIMPIYNAEKFLERTINSIINQSIGFENIELILVNDNSSDSSKKIIEDFVNKYPNIKSFHSTTNHGYPGYGRNVGLKLASSQYIMFIDNDDEYQEEYCEIMLNALNNENCDVVCANYMIKHKSGNTNISVFSRISNYENTDYGNKLVDLTKFDKLNDSEIWTKIFKKSIIDANNIQFIENGLNEDSLFLYEYYLYAKKMIYIDYYGYIWYRDHESLSVSSCKSTLEFINSYYIIIDFIKKNYDHFDLNNLYKGSIEATMLRIILSDNKRFLIEELYNFEKRINFNGKLNHLWMTLINNLILKQMYSLVIIIFLIIAFSKQIFDYLNKMLFIHI